MDRDLVGGLERPAHPHEEHGEDHPHHPGRHDSARLGVDEGDGEGHLGEREAVGLAVGALDPQGEQLAAEERDTEPDARDGEWSLEPGLVGEKQRVGEGGEGGDDDADP